MKYTKIRASCKIYVKCDNCGAKFPDDSPVSKFRLNGECKGVIDCVACKHQQVVSLSVGLS